MDVPSRENGESESVWADPTVGNIRAARRVRNRNAKIKTNEEFAGKCHVRLRLYRTPYSNGLQTGVRNADDGNLELVTAR
jgi:hypothetical protein